jgi:hypothetical protein
MSLVSFTKELVGKKIDCTLRQSCWKLMDFAHQYKFDFFNFVGDDQFSFN